MHIEKSWNMNVTVGNIIFSVTKDSDKVTISIEGEPKIDVEDIHQLGDVPRAIYRFLNDEDMIQHD